MEYDWINAAAYAKPIDKDHMKFLEGTAFKVMALYGCELNSIETTVAYLQDVLKDPEMNKRILVSDFGVEVADTVEELTYKSSVSWTQYLKTLKKNSLSWKVKVASVSYSLDEALKTDDKYKIRRGTHELLILHGMS